MAARQLAAVTVPEAGVAPNLAAAAWKESVKGERRGFFFLIKGKKRIGIIDYGPTRILHALCVRMDSHRI